MPVRKGGANAEAEAPNRSRLFPPALARRGVGHGYFGILYLVGDKAGRDPAFAA